MSGHSKWSTIKHQKQATDQKRGQTFTKLANTITLAVREGGGLTDPNFNIKLRMAIEKARQENMPKGNIERAIERSKKKDSEGSLTEVVYEGFGPGGIAIIAEGVTDNKQRTTASVKNIFSSYGGALGSVGSVAYQFQKIGIIYVEKGSSTSEQILAKVLNSGASDFTETQNQYLIYTEPNVLNRVKEFLQNENFPISKSEIIYKANIKADNQTEEIKEKIMNLIEKLEQDEDIHQVYTNLDFNK